MNFKKWKNSILVILIAVCGERAFSQASISGGNLDAQLQANADGTVTVLFQGVPGEMYQIEFTTTPDNIATWSMVGTVVAGAGWTDWIDTNAPASGQWFYQVVPQTMPGAQEMADSQQLIASLTQGDYQTALSILRRYGISQSTLNAMAGRLGQTPPRVPLSESFLTGTSSLSLDGETSDVQNRVSLAGGLGYGKVIWPARYLYTNWMVRSDLELSRSPSLPIGALDVGLDSPSVIRFFQWYDRYAEKLHSVSLNWERLNNHDVKGQFPAADVLLNAMFKLVKARKPDAFVWLGVVKQDDGTDVPFLQGIGFTPDGLLVSNLRQFRSPFGATRQKLAAVFGSDLPMVVVGFYGYLPPLKIAGLKLSAAKQVSDYTQRQTAKASAMVPIAAAGKVIGPELSEEQNYIKTLGYRGLIVNWRLVQAVTSAQNN